MKYSSQLNIKHHIRINDQNVEYLFKELEGLPQAGDLVLDLHFWVNDNHYRCHSDGWQFTATKDSEEISPSSERIIGRNIEDLTNELLIAYLDKIAPRKVVEDYIDMSEGWVLENGALKRNS